MGVSGQLHAPTALPPGKASVPIVQEAWRNPRPFRMGVGRENLLPSPGFEPQTIEPISSRYTDPSSFSLSDIVLNFYTSGCFK